MTSMLFTARYAAAAGAAVAPAVGAGAFIGSCVELCGKLHGGSLVQHHISLPQSRGVMFFSFAYFAADSSTIERTSSLSGWIQSVMTFHSLPSHCWNFTAPPPS